MAAAKGGCPNTACWPRGYHHCIRMSLSDPDWHTFEIGYLLVREPLFTGPVVLVQSQLLHQQRTSRNETEKLLTL